MSYGAPPPPAGQYGQPYGGAPAGNNQKAIWALVIGILSIVCCGPAGIAAIILANNAQKEIAASGQQGAGMAKAGLITGIIGLVLTVLNIILFATGAFSFDFSTN